MYDLGGGTFDVTLVSIEDNSFRAVATDGDVLLGGKDWDEALVNLAAERFVLQHNADPRDDPITHQELALAAEAAKRSLSERHKASIVVNHLGRRLKVEVTRDEFEEATLGLLHRTRATVELVVMQAGMNWPEIDRVLLVGGSTRMPMVAKMLAELSGKIPDASLSADEAVAHGAALFARLLLDRRQPSETPPSFSVINVNSHSLGLLGIDPATGRKLNKVLIPKNTPLPKSVSQRFRTHKSNQKNIAIRVLEGESELPEACTDVGTCVIRDLPAGLPAGWPVEVRILMRKTAACAFKASCRGTFPPSPPNSCASTISPTKNWRSGTSVSMIKPFLATIDAAPARSCVVMPHSIASGATNMAIDEAMLDRAAVEGGATVRTYEWAEPTLSLGYFQAIADVDADVRFQGQAVVRRPTGGGAIWHDGDLTYALAIPASHPSARRHVELYEVVHEAIARALGDFGPRPRVEEARMWLKRNISRRGLFCALPIAIRRIS